MTKTHQEISTANQKEGADAAESLAHYTGAPVPPPARTDGPWLIVFWRSDIAKKWLMALSGLALIGFVIVHMIGNLKLFIGKADINEYAEWLRTLGHPVLPDQVVLWIMRVGLLAAVVVHIAAAASRLRNSIFCANTGINRSRPMTAKNMRNTFLDPRTK